MKKVYLGKTLEDILETARAELGVQRYDLHYTILGEKKKLFSKRIEVECFTTEDIVNDTINYIKDIIESTDVLVDDVKVEVKNKRDYYFNFETNDNALIIGKAGKNIQALTNLARAFATNNYKKRFNFIVNVGDYKDRKYDILVRTAKKVAKTVQRTKIDAILDPMSNDERKAVHKALKEIENIATESEGVGKYRRLVVKYVTPK